MSSTTATAVPRTVTVAASPRDMCVLAIKKRTGYWKTSGRKHPNNKTRKVCPLARTARATPATARTASNVRAGSRSSTRFAPGESMARKATPGCGWTPASLREDVHRAGDHEPDQDECDDRLQR